LGLLGEWVRQVAARFTLILNRLNMLNLLA
jgi:hypothetical protein